MEDGIFNGAPHAITQTADGYLWIGTESGLVRFDGVRFTVWNPPDGKPLTGVNTLYVASDGSLWIGAKSGLWHRDGKTLTRYSDSTWINAILEDRSGHIWVAQAHLKEGGGPLCQVEGSRLRCYGSAEGIKVEAGVALAIDDQGSLWLGGSTGICRWRSGTATNFVPDVLRENARLAGVTAIVAQPDGSLIVAFEGAGLQRFDNGSWKPYDIPGLDPNNRDLDVLLQDRSDALWVGSTNRGLFRLHAGTWEHFGSEQGLSGDYVETLLIDREGNLWVTTTTGIDRFRNLPVATFSMREGLTVDSVTSVLAAHDTTVWIGNQGALDFVQGGKVSAITPANGLPGHRVTSLLQDHDGTLWVGVDHGLATYKDGHFHTIRSSDGQDLGVILGMTEDVDHAVWALALGKSTKAVAIRNGAIIDEIPLPHVRISGAIMADPRQGIWLGISDEGLVRYAGDQKEILSTKDLQNPVIRNLLIDSDGSIWAGSTQGLIHWNHRARSLLNSRNGLPCDSIYTLIKDNANTLWMSASCGFIGIADSELRRWQRDPHASVKARLLDSFDGAQPAYTPFRPHASKAPDGRLWFTNSYTVQVIDPNHLGQNTIPPPVHIEQAVADRKTYADLANLRLPPLTRDLEIDYTALSLSLPQKVRFRYILDGHDKNWIDAGTRRQAFYNDLRPGTYTFRVIACNNDGVWNEAGASLGLTLLPAFYQTEWFLLLCCAVVTVLVWLVYEWRMRSMEARLDAQFNARLAERTRIAQELHDTLLQGFLSASMQLHLVDEEIPAESPVKTRIVRILQLMTQVIADGRGALRGLRSSDFESDDLEQAFSRIPQEFDLQGKIEFCVVVQGEVRPLHRLIRDDVYRIAREAVANVFQHAHASIIEIELEYAPDELRVSVRDNGCGMDPQVLRGGREGHWGLPGMRERAERIGAQLHVWSRDSGGTEIELRVPGKLAFRSRDRRRLRWFDWF